MASETMTEAEYNRQLFELINDAAFTVEYLTDRFSDDLIRAEADEDEPLPSAAEFVTKINDALQTFSDKVDDMKRDNQMPLVDANPVERFAFNIAFAFSTLNNLAVLMADRKRAGIEDEASEAA